MLSNPPYGVDWKKYQDLIKRRARAEKGFRRPLRRRPAPHLRRPAPIPQHMISKMRDDEQGSRIGIVMNGSPLFTGGANSGESEIRRWMLENDWVEAIVALPTDLFYNTGIQTYVWLLNNRKPAAERRGKVQLIDASGERFWRSMRKSLGSKRREIPDARPRRNRPASTADMLNGERGRLERLFEDLRHHRLRLSRDPRRAPAQAELRGERGRASPGSPRRSLPAARRRRQGGDPRRAARHAGRALHEPRRLRAGAEEGAERPRA